MTDTPFKGKPLGPDLSRPGGIGELAVADPRLAVSLLGGCNKDGRLTRFADAPIRPDLIGWGEPSCGWGWEILNLTGRFQSGAAGQQVQGQLNGITESDLWVRKVIYTVRQPFAFPGSIFGPQAKYFKRMQPDIDFTLLIKSYCRYVISPDPTPLENIEQVFECVCPIGFVLGCSTQMTSTFVSNVALTGQFVPTEAWITFHAVRLPTRYDACAIDVAVDALRDVNLYPCSTCTADGPVGPAG